MPLYTSVISKTSKLLKVAIINYCAKIFYIRKISKHQIFNNMDLNRKESNKKTLLKFYEDEQICNVIWRKKGKCYNPKQNLNLDNYKCDLNIHVITYQIAVSRIDVSNNRNLIFQATPFFSNGLYGAVQLAGKVCVFYAIFESRKFFDQFF